ncbi:hypothetical protein [Rhizobium ruizarguesonis]|uniref:hypothetical protein n=1 Tax=Rhizobium ruizarguesonis TaxID=2081791 RepID=UPI001030E16E|nr:hypothetical protein [Rhizobium ruizarguesonis]TBB69193.1 hypothetical protein ELH45_00865 [Rhizobium ruizarguesonis]
MPNAQNRENGHLSALLPAVLLSCLLTLSCSDDVGHENVKRLEATDLYLYGENCSGPYWRFEGGGLFFHENGTVRNVLDKLALIPRSNDVLVVRSSSSSSSLTMVLTFSPDGLAKFTDVYLEPKPTDAQLSILNNKHGYTQIVSSNMKLPSIELCTRMRSTASF